MRFLKRYLRSPELVLAIANFGLMVWVFGMDGLDTWVDPVFSTISALLPFSGTAVDMIATVVILAALAPLMLPLTWIILVAAAFEIIGFDDWQPLVWWSVPGSVLWGVCVAYLYRLVRTGDRQASKAAFLTWQIQATPRPKCPHCGQPMPHEGAGDYIVASDSSDVATVEADV